MMSNALYNTLAALEATSLPASQPAGDDVMRSPLLLTVGAMGLVVLAVWVERRVRFPAKFALRNTPPRQSELNVVHLLVGLLGWALLPGLVAPVLGVREPVSKQDLTLVLLIATPLQIACILVLAQVAFRHGVVGGLGLSLRHWKWDFLRGVLGLLAVFPVCLLLAAAFYWARPQGEDAQHIMLRAMRELLPAWKAVIFFCTVVLVPMAEELLFRGLLQSLVRRYTGSPWFAIVATSIIFALAHVRYPNTMPALLALALVLGYNYERTGRLVAPIVIHGLFNAVNLIAVL